MTEKLKTLRDFEIKDGKDCGKDLQGNIIKALIVYPNDLRQEAINWIKKYTKDLEKITNLRFNKSVFMSKDGRKQIMNLNVITYRKFSEDIIETMGKIKSIKEFFNLTEEEEDLK